VAAANLRRLWRKAHGICMSPGQEQPMAARDLYLERRAFDLCGHLAYHHPAGGDIEGGHVPVPLAESAFEEWLIGRAP
jgi:hypothetical protein